ncbi:glycosyltransferase family 4 protein [Campylobacter pinnipediorum]|uniref:glycosyltransferase family 4 protein n=1 Tax=Campylobacter pinnipediorum TaxID=1965231 RepID=UPI00084D208D|nr:glycosyltransferase family 4 protein [Campylobacter pinnipediorum]AQW81745.1 glycosyltransferase, family 1 [Campylobacter pinnipediorum subsp. pinnipediorum]AQW83421.1 glycosyltransferase, family 1 [Campylobacter pinnipediorum subsp. pinnipediorum]AQW84942.1 glycosyltransferase, family 1 [Campylobacter pinnipediorum subsp. pinnipediorum]
MINILELESSKGFGGQEHRTQRVINGLDKQKFKVFYGLNKGSTSFTKDIDCEFVEFDLRKVYNIFEIIKICRFVKKNDIKIISTHSGKDGIIGSIVGKICKVKVIRTRHLQTPISSAMSYNLCTKVVAVSNATKCSLISKGVKENLIDVIYTGVDTNKFNPNFKKDIKKELNLASDIIVIGIVAVLRGAKNHKLLINAFNELSLENCALVIVGDGPQEDHLKEITKDSKNIFMLGNRTDVVDFMGSFDIFVLPSKMEALGTVLLEAGSCAVPCIGSNVGGIVEAILDNKTGFIFNLDNKEELKNAIFKLVQDKGLRYKFGKNAREYVDNNFSIEQMVKKTEILYETI